MRHSEQFVTEVLDRVVQTAHAKMVEAYPDKVPPWAEVDAVQRQSIKQEVLPMVLSVLDAAKDVRGEVHVATDWPLQDPEIAEALVSQPEGDDGRSDWTWLRTADGDLMLGLHPRGETYMALEGPAADDYDAAMTNDTLCVHRHPVDD